MCLCALVFAGYKKNNALKGDFFSPSTYSSQHFDEIYTDCVRLFLTYIIIKAMMFPVKPEKDKIIVCVRVHPNLQYT